MQIATAMIHEGRRANGNSTLTRGLAALLVEAIAPIYHRQVLPDATLHFLGRVYPAPGFLPRQIVRVSPVAGGDSLTILGGIEAHSDTSALSAPSRSSHRISRAARTGVPRGRQTTQSRAPSRNCCCPCAVAHRAAAVHTPFRKTGNAPWVPGRVDQPITVQPIPVQHILYTDK